METTKRDIVPVLSGGYTGKEISGLIGMFERPFSFEIPEKSLWRVLQAERRPVFLYGTGNGADKILSALSHFGVGLNGVFASPGFERNREFAGFHVESYDAVREKYGDDIVVILAFGTARDDVRGFIELLNRRHTLYIPDVPLYGGWLFEENYIAENALKIAQARRIFYDMDSIVCFDALIMFRLTGEYKYLLFCENTQDTIKNLFHGKTVKNIIDLGAFKGDSAALFAESFEGAEKIYAFEPDPKTFEKLLSFAASFEKCSIVPVNYAARDREETLPFSGSASRGAGVSGRNRRAKEENVRACSVDSFSFDGVDFIKYDVEGDEAAALRGTVETLKKFSPSLSVSLYHRTGDFFELPLAISNLLGDGYSFYLRRPLCIPFWDISLYAVRTGAENTEAIGKIRQII